MLVQEHQGQIAAVSDATTSFGMWYLFGGRGHQERLLILLFLPICLLLRLSLQEPGLAEPVLAMATFSNSRVLPAQHSFRFVKSGLRFHSADRLQ